LEELDQCKIGRDEEYHDTMLLFFFHYRYLHLTIICNEGKDICAFCRTPPASSDEEEINRLKDLLDKGNANAYSLLAGYYSKGICGLPQDHRKSNELLLKAGELGCASSYYNLGCIHYNGYGGVEVDAKKAKHYFELSAINGYSTARHNLGCLEGAAGNDRRAMKHYMIASKAGNESSLVMVKQGFMSGHVTKDEYANTLRTYQKTQDGMKSDARDKVAHTPDR